ncbi:hypothetical protein [Vulgatibacter incomptus]|uniref:Uncharacterized protein n=1 Tax=Vulgatibacter incomptus TaxID=1391653 RepID=A0A0K1PBG1_9BACT|nr:hypothetical protein [Vulgatibacter incomptus]AKU90832.1 hypothetical protein AKJ08_1219 [Vulgatibacter incomptus]
MIPFASAAEALFGILARAGLSGAAVGLWGLLVRLAVAKANPPHRTFPAVYLTLSRRLVERTSPMWQTSGRDEDHQRRRERVSK